MFGLLYKHTCSDNVIKHVCGFVNVHCKHTHMIPLPDCAATDVMSMPECLAMKPNNVNTTSPLKNDVIPADVTQSVDDLKLEGDPFVELESATEDGKHQSDRRVANNVKLRKYQINWRTTET